MKLIDLGKYSRPVLFERNCDEYTYSMLGTCFGIKYKNKLLLLTAKHVLDNFSNDEISVQYIAGSRNFLPINEINRTSNDEEVDDTFQFDIAVMKLEESLLEDSFDPSTFLPIPECIIDVNNFQEYIVFGFPQNLNEICYEKSHIKMQRIMLEISNITSSPYSNCFAFETDKEINGLSGSPVYGIQKKGENSYYCLVGIVIREKYFISINWLLNILRTI